VLVEVQVDAELRVAAASSLPRNLGTCDGCASEADESHQRNLAKDASFPSFTTPPSRWVCETDLLNSR
jgi:hypothetical protein